ADRNLDLDHDGVLNWHEIQKGTSPRYNNENFDDLYSLNYEIFKASADKSQCSGEECIMKASRLHLIRVDEFQDTETPETNSIDFSHDENENVYTVFVKLKKQMGFTGNSKMLFKDFKVSKGNQEFEFTLQDFK